MNRKSERVGLALPLIVSSVVVLIVGAGWSLSYLLADSKNGTEEQKSPSRLADIAQRDVKPSTIAATDNNQYYPVTIRPGPALPRITLSATTSDSRGEAISVACDTCHTTRPANLSNKQTSDLDEFHQGTEFSHSSLSCLSCHNADDYNSLRLADGTSVEFADVMTLCAQCHGPQFRDYQHGAHGGMTGYWDLTRGPRFRNNCVDCHQPHTPQFPKMHPTFKPRDRFLKNETEQGTNSHD